MEAPRGEVFVGRERELGQLERALDATRAGSGTTALVAGEAGIGKTRLASELATRARDARFEVLLGRSIDLSAQSCRTIRSPRPRFARSAPAGRWADGRLAAAGVPGDAGAAVRPRSHRPPAARARGSALGRYLDARSGCPSRAQPPRPADPAAGHLPRRRALLGRAHAPIR